MGVGMAEAKVISNQQIIIANQKTILANQKQIQKNQKTLQEILANQKKILAPLAREPTLNPRTPPAEMVFPFRRALSAAAAIPLCFLVSCSQARLPAVDSKEYAAVVSAFYVGLAG